MLSQHYEILNMMPDAILITDAYGYIAFLNKIGEKILGYQNEDVVGKPIEFIIPEKHHSNHIKNSSDFAKTPKSISMGVNAELYAINSNGESIPVEVNLSPLNINDNMFVMCALRDISERKAREKRLEENHLETKKYQLMLLSSQLNPHFIFNSLNAMQYFILDQKTEPALNFISNFSTLMRTVMQNSMKMLISLEEEIDFIKFYLDLEKTRHSQTFNYEISIDPEIDIYDDIIPPMLLQPYLENSVVHGIHNIADGFISVKFMQNKDTLQCELFDNGVGRAEAIRLKSIMGSDHHKSHGTQINQSRLDLLNSVFEGGFNYEIEDVKDDQGVCKGTRILLEVPLKK